MLRTLTAGFFARASLAALFFLVCFSFVVAKDEMTSSLLIGNARIDIMIEGSALLLSAKDVFRWVKSAAGCVTAYCGRFPVPQVLIRITPFEGRGVRDGMTFGDRGGRITIRVGSDTSPAEVFSDWMLTHEMVHLAFPSVDEKHHWIEEGVAPYVEPIARIRAGHLTAEQMWLDLVRDMPQGLPQAGDRGLDRTHTWGRTYCRCFVMTVGLMMPASDLPRELPRGVPLSPDDEQWIERGGSAIIGPDSHYIVQPLFNREELIVADLDFKEIDREAMTLDVSGHYARPDLFRFEKKELT